jgi:molybdopterin/thiamine biosynthesis adenylyltransferase
MCCGLCRRSRPADPVTTRALQVDVGPEDGRYHRQELISWWDQSRLAQARMLVVGAGALGNELLKALALLGVGHVLVIDMDRVENSNLSRCVLFRERDEGRFKAEVAAAAARELNPEIDVRGIVGDVRSDLGLGVFAAADIVLGGLDNREARLLVNERCWRAATPWIDGAIEGLMGTVRVFLPPDSACYECTMSENDHRLIAHRRSCALLSRQQMLEGKVPTTVTSAGMIASMQVQEAVKLLHRDKIEPTLAGKGVVYNGLTHDSYVVTFARRDNCLSHDTYEPGLGRPVPGHATFSELLARSSARPRAGDRALLAVRVVWHRRGHPKADHAGDGRSSAVLGVRRGTTSGDNPQHQPRRLRVAEPPSRRPRPSTLRLRHR